MDHRAWGAPRRARLAAWLGTVSFGVVGTGAAMAAAPATTVTPVEEVLITGSIIHGAPAVGVPVAAVSPEDFRISGALTIGDLLRTVPSLNIPQTTSAAATATSVERGTIIDLHMLKGERSLLMVDGMRYPYQANGANQIDPGVVPELSVERIDVLADGASATYGSNAIGGVVNVILKRRFEGAISQLRYGTAISDYGGGLHRVQAAQLFGTRWDSGDVTLSYQYAHETALHTTNQRLERQWTMDYTPWGLDNITPVASSSPGTVSTGAPNVTAGTGCTNCFSVPRGQNGIGLTWTTLLNNKGVANLSNPYERASLTAPQESNAATLTFDQKILGRVDVMGFALIEGAEVFVDAFYQNRRATYFGPTHASPGRNTAATYTVPTGNPFYPAGAPAGLRVSYNFNRELNPRVSAGEISKRWAVGFNLDLPFDWLGRMFYASSENVPFMSATNLLNINQVNAALGNTVASVAASGSIPGQAAFIKPANIPFINLFCDPNEFTCNSQASLDYISAVRLFTVRNQVHQWEATFDGPVFTLPAGEVRAAVGVQLASDNFFSRSFENFNGSKAVPLDSITSFGRQVPAAFAQVNVPVFGEAMRLPGFWSLDLEGSYRYDHYYDSGVVTSPKFAFNWAPIEGLVFRGSWGTSFRAPAASHLTFANAQIQPVNVAAGGQANNLRACPVGSTTPVPGSAGEKLVQLGLASCDPNAATGLVFPGGIGLNTGTAGAAAVRPWGIGVPLTPKPETSTNTNLGVQFTPTFLPGLFLEATWFNVHIRDFLFNPSISSGANLQDPLWTFTFIFPDHASGRYAEGVNALLNNPVFQASPTPPASNIKFIQDGAFQNVGFFKVSGVDFRGDFNWDTGNYGAIALGVSGTYYLRHMTQNVSGGPVTDLLDLSGHTRFPRFRYRGRVGWTDGSFSGNLFVNYQSHYFHQQATPSTAVLVACGCTNYSNISPNFVTADLALGYNTLDTPANEYLRNLNLQIVINNVADKHAPFTRVVQTQGANPNAFDSVYGRDAIGRFITFVVTKTW
jgi:iron complex outermembrane recepter protein